MGPQIPIVEPICGRAHDVLPNPSVRLPDSKDRAKQLLSIRSVPFLESKRLHNTAAATLALRIEYRPFS